MVSKKETLSLADLRVFCRVAETLNLTAAAEQLRIPKSAVSKTLMRLEAQVSARLMERSSRRVALTAAGRVLHERSVSLLSDADALMESLREERDEPQGLVRITAPDELGAHLIEHLLPQVLQRYPRLRFAVKLDYESKKCASTAPSRYGASRR